MDKEKELEDTIILEELEELKSKLDEEENSLEADILEQFDPTIKIPDDEIEAILENTEASDKIDEEKNETQTNPENGELTNSDENNKKKKKDKKDKKSLKEKWNSFTKKQKITVIVLSVILLIVIGCLLFFLLKKKPEEKVDKGPEVVIQKDNYKYIDGTLIILNEKEEEIGKYECNNKDEKLCYVAYESNEDRFDNDLIVDETGAQIDQRTKVYSEQYVFIYDNKEGNSLIHLYDLKENKVVETYQLIKSHGEIIVLKNKDGKYGVIGLTSTGVTNTVDFNYDYIGIANNQKEEVTRFVTKKGNKWYLTDFNGSDVTKAFSYEIKGFNNGYVKVVNQSGKYLLYNYEAQEIGNQSYDYIELLNDYAAVITNQKLYIRDYQNNRMNGEGIDLKSSQYRRKIIYNKETKETKIEQAYEFDLVYDTLNIKVYENQEAFTTHLNLLEGKISSNIKYVEYFDGILYFYKDLEKVNLIGSYACTNRNDISATTTTLNNCMIASDTKFEDNEIEETRDTSYGIIPIFNERFVFIYDTPTNKTNENIAVNLYDLSTKKALGKYNAVSTYSNNATNEVAFVTANDLSVVAQNKKGQFGMIKIENTKVSGVLAFNFQTMERIGNHIVASESVDGALQYRLYNSLGQVLAENYSAKIVDYNNNYVKVFKDGLYYIYDYSGQQVIPSGFNYIKLYDKIFATVTGNILNAYNYIAPTVNLIEDGVELQRNNFYKDEPKSFRITFTDANTFKVEIGTNDNTYLQVRQDIAIQ